MDSLWVWKKDRVCRPFYLLHSSYPYCLLYSFFSVGRTAPSGCRIESGNRPQLKTRTKVEPYSIPSPVRHLLSCTSVLGHPIPSPMTRKTEGKTKIPISWKLVYKVKTLYRQIVGSLVLLSLTPRIRKVTPFLSFSLAASLSLPEGESMTVTVYEKRILPPLNTYEVG